MSSADQASQDGDPAVSPDKLETGSPSATALQAEPAALRLEAVQFTFDGSYHPSCLSEAVTSTEPHVSDAERIKTRNAALSRKVKEVLQKYPNLNNIAYYIAKGSFRIDSWTEHPPEEMALFEVLMGTHQIGIRNEDTERVGEAAFLTFRECLAKYTSGRRDTDHSRWRPNGLDNNPLGAPVTDIIVSGLRPLIDRARPNDKTVIFDTAVLASMASGNAKEAVGLVLRAGDLLPMEEGIDHVENALTRIMAPDSGAFRVAYDTYPYDARKRIDAVLVSALADRAGEGSREIRDKARERLEKGIADKLDRRYAAQQVTQVASREKTVSDDELGNLARQVIEEGTPEEEIQDEIARRACLVVDGRVANLLAAELDHRLKPEHEMERVLDSIRVSIDGQRAEEGIYDVNSFYELSYAEDRTRYVASIPYLDQATLADRIAIQGSRSVGLNELIVLIREPDFFEPMVENAHRHYRNESHLKEGESDWDNWVSGNRLFGEKLVNGMRFLQTAAGNEDIRGVLQSEFGIPAKFLEVVNLEKAMEVLHRMYPDVIGAGEEKAEAQRISDERAIADLATARADESTALSDVLLAKLASNMDSIRSGAQGEVVQAELYEKAGTSEGDRAELEAARSAVEEARRRLEEAQGLKIAGRLFNTNGVTSAAKQEAIDKALRALEEAEENLRILTNPNQQDDGERA